MLVTTEPLIDSMDKWVRAIKEGDFTEAARQAERLKRSGELVAIHPDFRACFERTSGGLDPAEALLHVSWFLACATSGRAKAARREGR